jgi:hypothetical protein
MEDHGLSPLRSPSIILTLLHLAVNHPALAQAGRPNQGPDEGFNEGPNESPNEGPNKGPNEGSNEGPNEGPNEGVNDGSSSNEVEEMSSEVAEMGSRHTLLAQANANVRLLQASGRHTPDAPH